MVVFTCWDTPDENRFSAQVGCENVFLRCSHRGAGLGQALMMVYTCWDAPDQNRFSAQVGDFVIQPWRPPRGRIGPLTKVGRVDGDVDLLGCSA